MAGTILEALHVVTHFIVQTELYLYSYFQVRKLKCRRILGNLPKVTLQINGGMEILNLGSLIPRSKLFLGT